MKYFSKIFYTSVVVVSFMWASIFSIEMVFAQEWSVPDELLLHFNRESHGFAEISKLENGGGIVAFLSFVQDILLKLVLPLVAIGCGLYIAYMLFTAEWDESKMKKTWTAVTYSVIGIIAIILAYFIVDLIMRINF